MSAPDVFLRVVSWSEVIIVMIYVQWNSCPNDYHVLARSEDGEIEAIHHDKYPWEGWMWHPEREENFDERDLKKLINCLTIFSELYFSRISKFCRNSTNLILITPHGRAGSLFVQGFCLIIIRKLFPYHVS